MKNKRQNMQLYEVLLEEYSRLGVIDKNKREEIENKFDKFVGLNWKDLDMGHWVRAQKLKILRKEIWQNKKDKNEDDSKSIPDSPSALCFSGGGIRSATFCLGVLQGLAKYNLLDKFDYLSTVSGGGYIGSWLSAWVNRAGSIEKVQAELSRDEANPFLFELKDFNIKFDDPNAVNEVDKLFVALKKVYPAEEYAFTQTLSEYITLFKELKLSDKDVDLEKLSQKNYLVNEFLKEVCKGLNKILLRERKVFKNNEFATELSKASLDSIKDKNQEIVDILEGFLQKPYLFCVEDFKSNLKIKNIIAHKNSLKSAGLFDEKSFQELIAKGENSKDLFFETLKQKLDEKILEKPNSIERIKEKGRLYKRLNYFINQYTESDLLQNDSIANLEVEPEEITHLRTYSNYMSPKIGLFSSDTLSLVTLYVRNLLLNWLVFVPLIAAFLLLPIMYHQMLNNEFSDFWHNFALYLSYFFGFIAVGGIMLMRPSVSDYSFLKQTYEKDDIGKVKYPYKVYLLGVTPLLIVVGSLVTYWAWLPYQKWFVDYRDYSQVNLYLIGNMDLRLIYFMKMGGILLFLGFLLFRIILDINIFRKFREKIKNKSEENKRLYYKKLAGQLCGIFLHLIQELASALVSGFFGGSILYICALYFPKISDALKIDEKTLYICFAMPIFLGVLLLSVTLFTGIASKINNDMDREWINRFSALLLKAIMVWVLTTTIVLLGPYALKYFDDDWSIKTIVASTGGISGIITLVLGFTSKSQTEKKEGSTDWKSIIIGVAPQIAAPIFVVFLMILIAYLTNQLMDFTGIRNAWVWFIGFVLIGGFMGWFINVNKFSLHAMYRERLIRTYLGASRIKERFKTANNFTGLDVNDNVEMKYLFHKPFHIVNMTLNLVKTNDLKWQNRKAESFTGNALTCGSSGMGRGSGHYRSSDEYAFNEENQRAITLGTCAAISGAAASPNMGYYTVNSAVSFLMTLFNIRLGWWLGNPGLKGDINAPSFISKKYLFLKNKAIKYNLDKIEFLQKIIDFFTMRKPYTLASPRWAPRPLLSEAFGLTTDSSPYIYVSDGGHFENLGIYEMVLRRCRFIVACDSASDPDFKFSDLGNAIHKIRVDMGIPIIFDEEPVRGRYCSVAKIKYSEVDKTSEKFDGILIYIKPTIDNSEPIDIIQYQNANKDFPHETTADQMYSETQFESYRSLGFHTIERILEKGKLELTEKDSFDWMLKSVKEYMDSGLQSENDKQLHKEQTDTKKD